MIAGSAEGLIKAYVATSEHGLGQLQSPHLDQAGKYTDLKR